jgi:hypothetical protein
VLDPHRNVDSYTDHELAAMSVLELGQLSLAAEEQSWAVYLEHQDEAGEVPEHARRRAEELEALGERFKLLGQQALQRRAEEADDV